MPLHLSGWICRCVNVTLVIGAASALWSAAAADSLPSDAEIRSILTTRIEIQRRSVGIVVGVLTPQGRRIIAHGRQTEEGRPVDADTLFEIGSLTKIFTALLLGDALETGAVAADDPVAKHLDWLLPARGGEISLLDLATHRSGLPGWTNDMPGPADAGAAGYSSGELRAGLARHQPLADTGTTWAYSNLNYVLLAQVLSRRSGVDYAVLLEDRVMRPLRMDDTGFSLERAARRRLATGHGYDLRPTPPWNMPVLTGAGGLTSSANDLLRLLQVLVQPDSTETGTRLAAANRRLLETRRTAPAFEQALGWQVLKVDGGDGGAVVEIITHDGGTIGFASSLAYDRAAQAGVVVLSNGVESVNDIARHLLRPAAFPLSVDMGLATKPSVDVDAVVLEQYAGEYALGPSIAFDVMRDGAELYFKFPAAPRIRLWAESQTEFFMPTLDMRISFEQAADGTVSRLVMRPNGGQALPVPRAAGP